MYLKFFKMAKLNVFMIIISIKYFENSFEFDF